MPKGHQQHLLLPSLQYENQQTADINLKAKLWEDIQ